MDARGHAGANSLSRRSDPGIFPSFFFDYGKDAGRKAYLDIIERAVVNGSADGVYADCYGSFGLECGKNGMCTHAHIHMRAYAFAGRSKNLAVGKDGGVGEAVPFCGSQLRSCTRDVIECACIVCSSAVPETVVMHNTNGSCPCLC